MARKLSTREIVMLVVLGVAGALVLYYGRGGRLLGGGGATATPLEPLGDPPVIEMARLGYEAEDYDPAGRNLFEYSRPPAPPQAARPTPPPRKPTPVVKPKSTAATPPPPPPPTPTLRPPKIRFTYLGFLGPKDKKIAVFEQGEEILLAHAGEIVEEQFRLLEFKYESVLMGYVDERFRDETTELSQK